MKNDALQKFKLGLFVIAGTVLLLAVLFSLGLSTIFVSKGHICSYFTESVQGLNVGSAVKYRGVPIGTVSRIVIRVEDKLVRVDMDIDLDRFSEPGNKSDRLSTFDSFVRKEIQEGMRCRLEYVGITGLRYIDFDYFATPGAEVPKPPRNMESMDEFIFVPAVPSTFTDILKSVETALEQISRIRFEEISDSLATGLHDVSELLSDPALKSTIARVSEAAEHLEASSLTVSRVLSEERLDRVVNLLEDDLNSVNELANTLLAETRAAKMSDNATAFRAAAEAITRSQEELTNSLGKLNQTLDAITALAEMIDEDPSSLVRGKAAQEIKKR